MSYNVVLWRGLSQPYITSHQLNKAETYEGMWKKTGLLLGIAVILASISAYFGIGNGQLSKLIYETTSTEFSTIKALFGIGQVLQFVLVTAILIFFPALVFWIFTDIDYHKLVVIQLFVASLTLIEKGISIPLGLFWGLNHASSPFSLGVIAQYLTDYELIYNFFGHISLFSILAMMLQYIYLSVTTSLNKRNIILLILSLNTFMWLIAAIFTYIKFEVLL